MHGKLIVMVILYPCRDQAEGADQWRLSGQPQQQQQLLLLERLQSVSEEQKRIKKRILQGSSSARGGGPLGWAIMVMFVLISICIALLMSHHLSSYPHIF